MIIRNSSSAAPSQKQIWHDIITPISKKQLPKEPVYRHHPNSHALSCPRHAHCASGAGQQICSAVEGRCASLLARGGRLNRTKTHTASSNTSTWHPTTLPGHRRLFYGMPSQTPSLRLHPYLAKPGKIKLVHQRTGRAFSAGLLQGSVKYRNNSPRLARTAARALVLASVRMHARPTGSRPTRARAKWQLLMVKRRTPRSVPQPIRPSVTEARCKARTAEPCHTGHSLSGATFQAPERPVLHISSTR